MSFNRIALAAGFAFVLAATTMPITAFADDTAKQKIDWAAKLDVPITHTVVDACESGNATDQAYCYGMIMADYDANFYLADAMAVEPLCIPATATAEQLRKAFLDGAHADPDQLKGPFAIFFYLEMSQKFPCAQGVVSTPKPAHGLNPGNNTK